MDINQIIAALCKFNLPITSVVEIDYGKRIRLECGAVISAYAKGTVLVQGKLNAESREEYLAILMSLLPKKTRWFIK